MTVVIVILKITILVLWVSALKRLSLADDIQQTLRYGFILVSLNLFMISSGFDWRSEDDFNGR